MITNLIPLSSERMTRVLETIATLDKYRYGYGFNLSRPLERGFATALSKTAPEDALGREAIDKLIEKTNLSPGWYFSATLLPGDGELLIDYDSISLSSPRGKTLCPEDAFLIAESLRRGSGD